MIRYEVNDKQAGKRLDVFVIEHLPVLSRAYVESLTEQQKITVNGQPAKNGDKLKAGEKVEIDFDLKQLEQVPALELPVLYEDNDCLVLNKPVGILTHSKGSFNPEPTVATFIDPKVKDLTGERAGIVHRLDRATSGVIITAKNPAALSWLQKQFATRKAKKTYVAVIEGQLSPAEAIIDMPIERSPKKPQTFRVGSNGKPATTHYKTVQSSPHYSLLELAPTTGRTHQLRVHLAHLGHPIVGDTLYQGPVSDRLYLHAWKLQVTLPNKERHLFEAAVPNSFNALIKNDHA